MRADGFMVVDAPARKIAIFPNDSGEVVIAIQDGSATCFTELQAPEIAPAIVALMEADHVASPKAALMDAQYNAHCAIEKART